MIRSLLVLFLLLMLFEAFATLALFFFLLFSSTAYEILVETLRRAVKVLDTTRVGGFQRLVVERRMHGQVMITTMMMMMMVVVKIVMIVMLVMIA